jgi:hypothetical protein
MLLNEVLQFVFLSGLFLSAKQMSNNILKYLLPSKSKKAHLVLFLFLHGARLKLQPNVSSL